MDSHSFYSQLLEIRPLQSGACRVVSLANQKGGVGKTTTAVNLGAALAQRGHRVLVVDADPQANATTGLGLERGARPSLYDVLAGSAPLRAAVRGTAIPGLDVVPSSGDLAGAEVELGSAEAREFRLARVLGRDVAGYRWVLIDCPPSLGLLTVNALVAAADLVVPVQCEYYALEGLGALLATAERIRRSLNPALRIAGFLLTMYDARTKLAGQVGAEVRSHFGSLVFRTVVPRSVRLSEAPSFGEPVLSLDPSSRGAISYRLLAAEFERRYGVDEPAAETPSRGPGGRGYGTIAPEPAGLVQAWPPKEPWGAREVRG